MRATAEVHSDSRGTLTLVALPELPFAPERVYTLSDLVPGVRRGEHACRAQHRYLVVVSGQVDVTLDDGASCTFQALDTGASLHVPPLVWHALEPRTSDTVVLVFADGSYDRSDYIDDPSELATAAVTPSA